MNKTKAKEIMRQSFAALDSVQRARLRHHAEVGTFIFCGTLSNYYTNRYFPEAPSGSG